MGPQWCPGSIQEALRGGRGLYNVAELLQGMGIEVVGIDMEDAVIHDPHLRVVSEGE